ncbi:MAG: hypothetical protein ACYTFY_14650 [Planctomycetota bacterium]|jgi:hypothetical protein
MSMTGGTGGGFDTYMRYKSMIQGLQSKLFAAKNMENKKTAPLTQEQQVQKDYETAKQANEARYQDILGQYQGMETEFSQRDPGADYADAVAMADKHYNTGMGFLENAGVQEASDIRQSGHNRQQKFMSDAISRGVNVPGLMTSMQRGIDRDTTNNLGRMHDRLNTQRLNAHSRLSGNQFNVSMDKARAKKNSYADLIRLKQDKLRFMENKTDGYPNVGAIAQYNAR